MNDPLVEFIIAGDPVPKGRPRISGGRAVTPDETRKAEADFIVAAKQALRGAEHLLPLAGAVDLEVVFTLVPTAKKPKPEQAAGRWHTQTPDVDNLLKLVCDALNGLVWNDDAQVARVTVSKRWGTAASTAVKVGLLEVGDD